MNMKIVLASAFLSSLFFVSCKKELQPQESSEATVTESVSAPENSNVEPQQLDVNTQNPQTGTTPNPVQSNPVQAQPTTTAPGMNPPHGQPNHRCDIAVGAPLNSPKAATPAPTPAPVQQPTPQGKATVTPVDMSSGTTATPPGMNPPHGQPGHRCEIAVGAPLPK